MPTTFTSETLANGRLKLTVEKDGQTISDEMSQQEAAIIAVQLLKEAMATKARSGAPYQDFTKEEGTCIPIIPTSIGLGPAGRSDCEALMLQFGDALIACEFDKTKLHGIGTAMMALSAPKARYN